MSEAPGPAVRLAVLGKPIAHSKSPALHRAAYAVLGLPWDYRAAEVDEAALADYVTSRDASWRGLSLTMPLKQTVQPLLDSIDRIGQLTGAVNTLLFRSDGGRSGFNTDVPGIVRALRAAGTGCVRQLTVLGGGATAASAIAAAAELGAEHVRLGARSRQRAQWLEPLAASVGLTLSIDPLSSETAAAFGDDDSDLLISTLPGGAETGLAFSAAYRARVPLLDVAYDPWPTAFAAQWSAAGGSVLSGLAMLVQQALLQVRVFVNGDPLEPLEREDAVLAVMLAAAGLGEDGRPVPAYAL